MRKLKYIAIGALVLKSVAGMGQHVEEGDPNPKESTKAYVNNVPKINLVGGATGKISLGGLGPIKPWASYSVNHAFKPSEHHFLVDDPNRDSIDMSSAYPPQRTSSFGVGADYSLNPNTTITAGFNTMLSNEYKKTLIQAGVKRGLQLSDRASMETYAGIFNDRHYFRLHDGDFNMGGEFTKTGIEGGIALKYKLMRDFEVSAGVGVSQALTTKTVGFKNSSTEARAYVGLEYTLPLRKPEFELPKPQKQPKRVSQPRQRSSNMSCPAHGRSRSWERPPSVFNRPSW